MLFDKHKRHIATGDFTSKGKKLGKGKYTLRLQFRHDSTSLLESLSKADTAPCMVLDIELAKPISLSVFPSKNAVVLGVGGAPTNKFKLERGASKTLWLGGVKSASIPAQFKAGDVLTGRVMLTTPHHKDLKERKNIGYSSLVYVPVPGAKEKKAAGSGGGDKKSNGGSGGASAKFTDPFDADIAVRDMQIDYLKSLIAGASSKATLAELKFKADAISKFLPGLVAKYPKHLPLLSLALSLKQYELNDTKLTGGDAILAAANAVLSACDALIAAVDQKEMYV